MCKVCPDYEMKTSNGRGCRKPKCGPRERITRQGSCEMCEDYRIASMPEQTTCVLPDCSDKQFITKNGLCQSCEKGKLVSIDRRSCVDIPAPPPPP